MGTPQPSRARRMLPPGGGGGNPGIRRALEDWDGTIMLPYGAIRVNRLAFMCREHSPTSTEVS
jgi:hypothetical protein